MKQVLVKAQNEYVEDAKAALLVNRHPKHPATRKADESYNRMMRIMLGEGLVLPQGYHVVDRERRLPHATEQ